MMMQDMMTVGALKKILADIPDDMVIEVSGDTYIEDTTSGWINVEGAIMGASKGYRSVSLRATFGIRYEKMR